MVLTRNLFLWWWPQAKVLTNWNLSTSSVYKWTNHIQKWPIVEMLQLTLFWKKNIFYKFHCWFLGEKCTLKNISENFGTHKKPFYMVMTTSKSFEKLKFKHFKCPKMNQSRPKMAHKWNTPTNFDLKKKNIFYKFHCWFLGEKCTLKNISKNFGTHKKPFYMVMTTNKSFEKLKFQHFKCP